MRCSDFVMTVSTAWQQDRPVFDSHEGRLQKHQLPTVRYRFLGAGVGCHDCSDDSLVFCYVSCWHSSAWLLPALPGHSLAAINPKP